MISKVPNRKNDENDIISGILENDPQTIRNIYNTQYIKIRAMVSNFKTLNIEAEDVFQEGLTRAVINVRKGLFKGDSTFSTYLYGICRNLCLKEYNKFKDIKRTEVDDFKEEISDDYYDAIQVMLRIKNKLDSTCIKIINMRFGINNDNSVGKALKFDAIAGILKITADNARQKFGRCMSRLRSLISENNEFNQIMD